jgi:hypothetical protein
MKFTVYSGTDPRKILGTVEAPTEQQALTLAKQRFALVEGGACPILWNAEVAKAAIKGEEK